MTTRRLMSVRETDSDSLHTQRAPESVLYIVYVTNKRAESIANTLSVRAKAHLPILSVRNIPHTA